MTGQKFLSEDEIVADMLKRINAEPKSLESWQRIDRKALISMHHGVGTGIRNFYKLWEHPACKEGAEFVDEHGIASHPNHPDQMSFRIMERIWDELHKH